MSRLKFDTVEQIDLAIDMAAREHDRQLVNELLALRAKVEARDSGRRSGTGGSLIGAAIRAMETKVRKLASEVDQMRVQGALGMRCGRRVQAVADHCPECGSIAQWFDGECDLCD